MLSVLKGSDLMLKNGVLLGRTSRGRPYERIHPNSIKQVKEISWARPILLTVWLQVRTEDETYTVSGARADYDDIVRWLSRHTDFHLEGTFDYTVNRVFYRASVRSLLGQGLRWLFRRKRGESGL